MNLNSLDGELIASDSMVDGVPEKVKAIMSEKSGSLAECFKVLDVDHSQGLDPGEFTTILMCVE